MIYRDMTSELQYCASVYPVVTLIGPRQSGKTSLVKDCFPNKPYYNLEAPDVRNRIILDPRQFLSTHPDGAILDEIQNVPELLSYIQVHVDELKKNNLYILTGSHQLSLHQAITQSLAGRTAVLNLLPLSIAELKEHTAAFDIDDFTFGGFYPRMYQEELPPQRFYQDYFSTYVERDVRQLIHVKDLRAFQNFMRLFAGRVGQLLNLTNIGNEVGTSHNTIKHWLSILEASFVVFRLEPYHQNISKRVVKTPKYYFVDPGLACYLLGIESKAQLARDPLRGNLIENTIIIELVKARFNQGKAPQFYFYRDNQGHEVDLIFKQGQSFIPIEIKASQTFHPHFLEGLDFFTALLPEATQPGYLIYTGKEESKIHTHQLLNFKHADQCVNAVKEKKPSKK